ncbi:LacI family DNA-binding transcriptional regulator [Microbacterium hatanonis]
MEQVPIRPLDRVDATGREVAVAVSIKDVAARAGVSVGTVSNVLNQLATVSADVSRRVADAISALGYIRNDAARQLRAGQSRSIGLILPDIGNPFFADVVRGADRRAGEFGITVLIVTSDGRPDRENALLELLLEQRVRGVMILPAAEDLTVLRRVAAAGTPVVLVDRETDDPGLRSVAVDDVEGGYLAASHLLGLGRRRILVVAGPDGVRQVVDRIQGARRAVSEHDGAELAISHQPAMTVVEGHAAGLNLLEGDRNAWPDAVFAANDLLAIGLIQALGQDLEVRIPGDIAVIGYDDIDFAAAAVVPLSSIRQPGKQRFGMRIQANAA